MPNLFPTEETSASVSSAAVSSPSFGRSWRFDFARGEFVLTPTGKVAQSADAEAWLEWCQKAMLTPRYRHLAYSRAHGQEYEDLIARHLSREANESEIKRMTIECLMLNPRTASVSNFSFQWDNDSVYFTCEISNVRSVTATLSGSVVIS